MEKSSSNTKARYQFIDFARGIVMAIMAWDHVSGFWNRYHHGGEGILGQAPPFRNTFWFLERFVSHVCAPTFIFLTGTVLAISISRRLVQGHTQNDIDLHLIKRGIVFLILEALLVSPAFRLPRTYFGVIACIGVCLILFTVIRKLPTNLIFLTSLIVILIHPFLNLDFLPGDTAWGWYARVIIHEPNFDWFPWVGLYPIIPWIGVMGLGWSFGSYLSDFDVDLTDRLAAPLCLLGVFSICLFFVIRWRNGFGNLLLRQGTSLVDWLYVSKYPPSLAFLCWTLGLMCIFLAVGLVLEKRSWIERSLSGVLLVFGRNPLFFYLAHLWFYRRNTDSFLEVWQTFFLWIIGLVVLWQLSIRYEKIKQVHRKWLQYI